MRVLALDHGSASCGCALSDPTGTIVRPAGAVADPDTEAGLRAVADLASDSDAELVVVGLPLLASGEAGAQAAAARSFAGRLGSLIAVPIQLYDERFTTRMAQNSLEAGAISDEDSLAAAHLLEDYLRNESSQPPADEDR